MKTLLSILFLTVLSALAQQPPESLLMSVTSTTVGTYDPSTAPGFVAQWDADVGVYTNSGTTLAANGDSVQRWVPKSGGMNLEDLSTYPRPLYMTSALNGHACISFDGVNTNLLTNIWPGAVLYAQPNTIFLVAMDTNKTGGSIILDGRTATHRNAFLETGTHLFDLFASSDVTYGTFVEKVWWVITVQFNAGSSFVRTNGVPASTSASSVGTYDSDGITVGCRYALTSLSAPFKLCELLFYSGAGFTAEHMTNVENYLKSKYALP